MKKIVAIGIAVVVAIGLTGCVAYQPPKEDASGGDVRVAVYGRNPLGFQPGTGNNVDTALVSVVGDYNWLTSMALPATNELGIVDSNVSGGATVVGEQWTLYKECNFGFGSYTQTTTVFPKSNLTVQSQVSAVVAEFENAGWSKSTLGDKEVLYKTGTGVNYTTTSSPPNDFIITINILSDKSFNLVLGTQGCLPLDALPEGKVIADVNKHVGLWRQGYEKQSW